MTDPMEDYKAETLESEGREVRLLPDEREALQEALSGAHEILRAPGETDPDFVFAVIETFEELHPYFSDTQVSDQIGEVIELLQEICEESVLDFEDAQNGKRTVETVSEALGIELSDSEI